MQLRSTTLDGAQVVLQEIFPDAPAEKSGLLTGDVLLKIGDQNIRDISDVDYALFYLREGQFVTVKVLRGAEEIDFTLRVAPHSRDQPFLAEAKVPEINQGNETPFKEGVMEQASDGDTATSKVGESISTESENNDQ